LYAAAAAAFVVVIIISHWTLIDDVAGKFDKTKRTASAG